MKKNLEEVLRDAPLTKTPESLDLGVESMIRRARRDGARRARQRVPLWVAAAACAAGVMLGFVGRPLLVSDRPGPVETPAVIYIEEPFGSLPDVLGGNKDNRTDFFERERGDVKVLYQG